MATIDIGKIKQVWRGTYASGTAYTPDDVVQYTDSGLVSSYICIANTTGNAPSSSGTAHGSWNYLAKGGVAGTNGTDVGAALANKEIAFKTNAGAVDGIPIGTAGQFLKVNSGATGYEYGAVSSDFVKIASGSFTASATLDIQQCFSSTYEVYKLFLHLNIGSSDGNNYPEVGFLDASNNPISDTYFTVGHGLYMTSASGNSRWTSTQNQGQFAQSDSNGFRIINTWQSTKSDEGTFAEMMLIRPDRAAKCMMQCTASASQHNYNSMQNTWGMHDTSTVRKGIRVNSAGGVNFDTSGRYYVYGMKP